MKLTQKSPSPIDAYVGAKVRLQRQFLQLSQTALAEALGITFQQVQKYEKGVNRIGASRLQAIARVLGVPISFFFKDAEEEPVTIKGIESASLIDPVAQFLGTSEGVKLNRAFTKIKDQRIRRAVLTLVKTLASNDAGERDMEDKRETEHSQTLS
jgi:transcriptional regulator with XRE-family HTH domain